MTCVQTVASEETQEAGVSVLDDHYLAEADRETDSPALRELRVSSGAITPCVRLLLHPVVLRGRGASTSRPTAVAAMG